MEITKEELATINMLIDGTFDAQTGQFKARGVVIADRVNSYETFKKVQANAKGGVFIDGEIELNAQEIDYVKRLLSEVMPAEMTRISMVLTEKLSALTV